MQSLEAAWHEARRRWPGIGLGLDDYASDVAAHAGEAVEGLHLQDLYLAAACGRGDAAALAAFDEQLLSSVGKHLAKIDRSPEFADEVRQALRVRLLVGENDAAPRIRSYSGQGPLGGWLRVAALRVALTLRRGQRPTRSPEEILELASGSTPELQIILARSRAAVEAAIRAAFASLSADDRSLLRLHLLEDLSIDALADLYKIHRSTAARRISACRQEIVEQTLAELQRKLQLTPADLASLLGLVRSRLELSLGDLLATLP